MILKDLIKSANDILGLTIDWNHTSDDENYQHLYACARLVVNTLTKVWAPSDSYFVNLTQFNLDQATMIYGILAEYAFVAGMFNEWKVWQEKYNQGLFKARHGQSRFLKV